MDVFTQYVGMGLSVATLVSVGGVLLRVGRLIERIDNIGDSHKACKTERERVECEIFERLSDTEKAVSYQRGVMNGGGGK
jgi:hypothetical protein